MDKTLAKEELIKRYIYLYQNAPYILAPFIKEFNNNLCLQQLSPFILQNLEMFLFENVPLKQNSFYITNEIRKNMLQLQNEIEKEFETIRKYQKKLDYIDILLNEIQRHITNQLDDQNNKKIKLEILKKYFNLSKIKNINQINIPDDNYNNLPIIKALKHSISKLKSRVKINDYLTTLDEMFKTTLTDDEIKKLYLTHLSEFQENLIYDLEITCTPNNSLSIQNKKYPCYKNFYILEEKIYNIDNNYYQICPHCGYIVNIPEYILSYNTKQRIKKSNRNGIALYDNYSLLYYINSTKEKDQNNKIRIKKQDN